MKNLTFLDKIVSYGQKLLLVCCTIAVFSLAWMQVFTQAIPTANAEILDQSVFVATLNTKASERAMGMDETGDEIRGKIKENFDTAKNNIGKNISPNPIKLDRDNAKTQQNIQEGNPRLYNASSALKDTAKDLKEKAKSER